MANLLETSTFAAGITRIETTEPVIGGEDGVANRAPKLLASRTRWLKDQIDALAATLGSLYALRTGDYTTLRARATTKDDVGLGLVANYAPTNDASGGSTTKVATAAAVQAALASVVVAPTNLGVGGTGDNRTVTSSTGAAATLPLATSAAAGLMRAADKAKLDAVAPGAEANVGTNITTSVSTTQLTIFSSTGGDATVNGATQTTAGILRASDKAKLDGIAFNAEVNDPTDLGVIYGAASITVTSSTGANASILNATTTQSGMMGPGDKSRLDNLVSWPGVYSGSSSSNLTFPIGATVLVSDALKTRTSSALIYLGAADTFSYRFTASGSPLTGTWRARGAAVVGANITEMERIA